MKRNSSWTLSAVVLLGGLPFVGATGGQSAPQTLPEGVTAAAITAGQAVFEGAGACYTCHGKAGIGTGLAPNLADATWLHSDGSYKAIAAQVKAGVPQPKVSMIPMLPKGGSAITDEQINQVSAYVWSLSHPGAK
jgi:mono/diheme cytochrome c family protein